MDSANICSKNPPGDISFSVFSYCWRFPFSQFLEHCYLQLCPSCYPRLGTQNASPFSRSVMHVRFFDFSDITCLRKPAIPRTFNSLPARRNGFLLLEEVLLLAFYFSLQFSAALPQILCGLCFTDLGVDAEGNFLASLKCFLNDHSIIDPSSVAFRD